jgi:hypothetical protein
MVFTWKLLVNLNTKTKLRRKTAFIAALVTLNTVTQSHLEGSNITRLLQEMRYRPAT